MVSVDREECIGCGSCEALCPEVFEMDEEMRARVKSGKEKTNAPCVKDAKDSCSVNAISI